MVIRPYRTDDCAILAQIYYDTIHTVNAADYTKAQLDAWATGNVDLNVWNEYFLARHSFVAELDEKIVGFADMDDTGYLGRLYVHHRHQGMGIGKALCDAVEKAVNYLTVYEIVRDVMKIKCRTIERVAQNIIHAVKEQFPQIVEVECSVAKLAPPLGGKIGRVSVVLKG